MMAIERHVDAALSQAGFTRGGSLLVAVSGGPDSTCLIRALMEIRTAWEMRF